MCAAQVPENLQTIKLTKTHNKSNKLTENQPKVHFKTPNRPNTQQKTSRTHQKTSNDPRPSPGHPVPSGAVWCRPVPSPGAHAAVRHPPGSAPRGPGLLPSRLWGRHGARLRALGFNGGIMECSYGIWVIYG